MPVVNRILASGGALLSWFAVGCGPADTPCAVEPCGACEAQPECAPGALEQEACGSAEGACETGLRARTCSDTCGWSGWSECEGDVGPATEACGDGVDDNCNGSVDEYCVCAPVEPGVRGTVADADDVTRLLPDPHRCLLYAIVEDTRYHTTSVHVIDLGTREVIHEIDFEESIADVEVSPDGLSIVMAVEYSPLLYIVDTATWAPGEVEIAAVAHAIAPISGGSVLYIADDNLPNLRSVSLAEGAASDRLVVEGDPMAAEWYADLELSPAGDELYVLAGGGFRIFTAEEEPRYLDYTHIDVASGYVGERLSFVGAGRYLSTERFLFEAADLSHRVAYLDYGDEILASDAQVGISDHLFQDMTHGWPVASFDGHLRAAAMVMEDQELWTRDYYDEHLVYVAAADMLDRSILDDPHPPAPAAGLDLWWLLHHGEAGRLTALDAAGTVVGFDLSGAIVDPMVPLTEFPAGMFAAIDGGAWLLQSHLRRVVHIDPATMHQDGEVDLTLDSDPIAAVAVADDRLVLLVEGPALVLVDGATGAVLDQLALPLTEWGNPPKIAASASANRVFAVETFMDSPDLAVVDVVGDELQLGATLTVEADSTEQMVALPDGSGAYVDGSFVSMASMATEYALPYHPYFVSGDSRLAITLGSVYRVSDGAFLGNVDGELPGVATADGSTLYLWNERIIAVDLTAY